jgi:hypothetical protein
VQYSRRRRISILEFAHEAHHQENTMAPKISVTNALTSRLRHAFTTAQIADWADSLARMQALGLKVDDVFPQGIPMPDTLVMKTHVPIADIGAVILNLHQQIPVRKIDIFPVGIPAPDMWRVRVGVGLK